MAVQWSSAASLDRWMVRCFRRPPIPCRASAPAVPSSRQARKGSIGCASVPRELAVAANAEPTAPPDVEAEEEGVVCEGCSGTGWLLCDFCKGKKNNVKSDNSPRVYRRCPTCKAAGYILCPTCRVYKCRWSLEEDEM